jgi:hypothetical protein
MLRPGHISILFVLLLSVYRPNAAHASTDEVGWLLAQINCLRQSLGVGPLALNASLSASATQQSHYLATNKAADMHVQADGSTPISRAAAAGFKGWVGENVSGGTTAQRAFAWWLSDDIHYRNMTNMYWSEVGIGIASGPRGTWYTLDFGAKVWKPNRVTAAACGSFGQTTNNVKSNEQTSRTTAVPQPPAFVVGRDEQGNIKHQVRPGDTLGHIAVTYGYTWDDIPTLLALNQMTQADFRNLKIGAIFLVPSKSGTYTPVPATVQFTPTAAPQLPAQPSATDEVTITLPAPTTSPTLDALPTLTPTSAGTRINVAPAATLATVGDPPANVNNPIRSLIPWGIMLQVMVLGGLFVRALTRPNR